MQSFQAIKGTIRAYTHYTLKAFKQVAIANIDKVTLEFGIELGGEAGVPYVTKGTAKSNLKITVECSFPERTQQQSQPNQGVPNQGNI
ncbi:MAG TPA: CU044_2847 family protein [Allocoleopsis sp.]